MAIGASTIGLYRFLYSTTFGQTIFRNGNLKKTDHKKRCSNFSICVLSTLDWNFEVGLFWQQQCIGFF